MEKELYLKEGELAKTVNVNVNLERDIILSYYKKSVHLFNKILNVKAKN